MSGTVGNVSAALTATDATGATVAQTQSDATSRYEVEIPSSAAQPITITAQGGTDLVTGTSTDFDLVGVTSTSTAQTINLSPLTTLATRIAECTGSVTESSIETSWSVINQKLGMGLRPTLNPMNEPVGSANAAELVLANAALQEMVRRTSSAMAAAGATLSGNDILKQVACDLQVDAVLNGVGNGVDPRAIATFRAAEAAVLLEVIAGQLSIAGQDATALMDLAIATILGSSGVTVGDVTVIDQLIDEARSALSLFLVHVIDGEILTLALLFNGNNPAAIALDVAATLDSAHQVVMWGMPDRVALADATAISALTDRMNQQDAASVPVISLAASEAIVNIGTPVILSWTAAADRCYASDGWSGEVNVVGSATTPGLTQVTDYVLQCAGLGGATAAMVSVNVIDPNPAPVTSLTVANETIGPGGATTLSWSSVNTSRCRAFGAWVGSRSTAGSESTGTLSGSRTYTLICSGSGGSDTASVTVRVDATIATKKPTPTVGLDPGDTKPVNQPPDPGDTDPVNPASSATVSLSAADPLIDSGALTTLTWSSTNADSCTASGGWAGSKTTSGNETVGPLVANTSFALTCSGADGNAVTMIMVNVTGALTLNWVAPTENVDGTPLTDLAGYRIYYGDSRRAYLNSADVNDSGATSYALTVPSGSYYVVMTALNLSGDESAYSNEILKSTN